MRVVHYGPKWVVVTELLLFGNKVLGWRWGESDVASFSVLDSVTIDSSFCMGLRWVLADLESHRNKRSAGYLLSGWSTQSAISFAHIEIFPNGWGVNVPNNRGNSPRQCSCTYSSKEQNELAGGTLPQRRDSTWRQLAKKRTVCCLGERVVRIRSLSAFGWKGGWLRQGRQWILQGMRRVCKG